MATLWYRYEDAIHIANIAMLRISNALADMEPETEKRLSISGRPYTNLTQTFDLTTSISGRLWRW
jgi:hypothetical protein